MPRTNNNNELIRRLVGIDLILPLASAAFDQTTAGATAKGSSTITVPAITNATAADPVFIIGSNGTEINELGTPNTTMPVKYKTAFQHPAGTRLLEATIVSLGRIEVGGFTLSPSQQETLIEAADQDTAVQTIKGTLELGFSFGLLYANAQNLLNALGYDDNETGVGTSADPYQSTVGDPNATTLGIVAFRVKLLKYTGATVYLDLTECSIASTGSIQMGAKNAASITPFAGKAGKIVRREWT